MDHGGTCIGLGGRPHWCEIEGNSDVAVMVYFGHISRVKTTKLSFD